MSKFEEFSNSEVGKKAMHARRKRKRVMIWISDKITPQNSGLQMDMPALGVTSAARAL
ncbi:hypothetical protein ACYZT3_15260 [Pseudomonas sp. MDT1-16]